MLDRSGVNREVHAPFSERLEVRFLRPTQYRLHWCLDVTFGEDACRNRTGHAPENLNIVRKIAMNLLRLDPLKKTLPKKRVRASVNPQYLAQILGASA